MQAQPSQIRLEPWKHVLVYAGGRTDTLLGIHKALHVANAMGGRVTAFDTVDGLPSRLPSALAGLELADLVRSACDGRSADLAASIEALRPRVHTKVVVKPGMASVELIKHALRTNADLIIKTALGRDLRRMTTFGSTALHLVRKSPVPVWLHDPRHSVTRRVLAFVDPSNMNPQREEFGRRILAAARRVAELEDAELHVVHVTDVARERLYRSLLTPDQYEIFAQVNARDGQAILERFISEEAPNARLHLRRGDPAEEIADCVRDESIDLVVIGSVAPSEVAGLLIGELSEELLCRVDCSVVTLKPEGFISPIRG